MLAAAWRPRVQNATDIAVIVRVYRVSEECIHVELWYFDVLLRRFHQAADACLARDQVALVLELFPYTPNWRCSAGRRA